jgi:hypothetical protein
MCVYFYRILSKVACRQKYFAVFSEGGALRVGFNMEIHNAFLLYYHNNKNVISFGFIDRLKSVDLHSLYYETIYFCVISNLFHLLARVFRNF